MTHPLSGLSLTRERSLKESSMNLHFVTGNKDKLREAEAILGIELQHIDLSLDEIQELDPIKIAEHKARQAWGVIKEPLFVWDLSIYIDCLNGFPGPLIKWFWKQVTLSKICEIAGYFGNTKIVNETILVYYDGKHMEKFTAHVEGTIPPAPRGEKGWGWDAIFIPQGSSKTYAEMEPVEVLQFRSHRKVLIQLRDYLEKHTR